MDRMTAFAKRVCPECGSKEYMFRARRNIPAVGEAEAAEETKYACRPCGFEWKERLPVVKKAG
jgi:DNA-directed RNA polymerase subunit M/transcription elongation factor TFIIS